MEDSMQEDAKMEAKGGIVDLSGFWLHRHVEVWVPPEVWIPPKVPDFRESAQEKIMDYVANQLKLADWCQWWALGGRFKGAHARSYDPGNEPDERELCRYCNGVPLGPSEEGEPHETDIIPVGELRDGMQADALLVRGECFLGNEFDFDVKKKLAELGITDGYLVTVDSTIG